MAKKLGLLRAIKYLFMVVLLNTLMINHAGANQVPDNAVAGLAALVAKRGRPIVYNQNIVKYHKHSVNSSGRIMVPNDNDHFSFDFQYYRSREVQGRAPLVFIYCGLGGVGILEKLIAKNFAKRGVSTVISHYFNENEVYDLAKTPEHTLKTLRANLALVDYFSGLDEVDAERLAIVGISYGGIRGLYHMASDPRIKAASLMVAGAPLSEVMAYSELPQVAEIRDRQMRAAGLATVDEYLAALRQQELLPLELVLQKRNPDDFYLFISNRDTWVPSRYQWKVVEMLGSPRYRTYALGHMETPAWVTLHRFSLIHNFFREKWQAATGGVAAR